MADNARMWKRLRESTGGPGMVVLGVTLCVLGTLGIAGLKVLKDSLPPRRSPSAGQIYKRIFAAAFETPQAGGLQVWAREGSPHYETSTGYFRWLMTDVSAGGAGVLDEEFGVFAFGSYRNARTLEEFGPEHNIWSVVTGMDEVSPAGMPFLISRNLNEDRLVDWEEIPDLHLGNLEPFPRRKSLSNWRQENVYAVVVIRSGGASEVLQHPRQLTWGNLNPTRATNRILNP